MENENRGPSQLWHGWIAGESGRMSLADLLSMWCHEDCMECVPAPPLYKKILLAHYKIFYTPIRDELACLVAWQYSSPPPHPHTRQSRSLVWNLSPSPNETISFVSFESTVFQCNSGREYSNKLRGQSCKGPLNATHHASSIHIYRGSQNIRGCPYITLYYFGLFLTHTPLN